MKVGILRETKTPEDNRVALTPSQIKELSERFPEIEFKVQSSDSRCFKDDEYRENGIEVLGDVNDCDLLIGIKEVDKDLILPDKYYLFFGHIAKMQEYNKPLFKKLIDQKTTFTDYEYLVDEQGLRVVAFGWFAGIVGVYYTLMGWGHKNKIYQLPLPHLNFSTQELLSNLNSANIKGIKIVLTGTGRVSQGAQYVLNNIGANELSPERFLEIESSDDILYTVLPIEKLVAHNNRNVAFSIDEFSKDSSNFHSIFQPYIYKSDILISCHFWNNGDPVYLSESDLKDPNLRIRMVGDITCDMQGSIKSTLRSSTHKDPFYDYNPKTNKEEPAFSSNDNISVMAVDTCPNALPREASQFFGEQLINNVLIDLFTSKLRNNKIYDEATILNHGRLTSKFNYLQDYIETFK